MGDFSTTEQQRSLHVVVETIDLMGRLLNTTFPRHPSLDPHLVTMVIKAFERPWQPLKNTSDMPMVFATWRCTDRPGAWAIHLSMQGGRVLISYDRGGLLGRATPLLQVALGDLEGKMTALAHEAQHSLFRRLVDTIFESGVSTMKLYPAPIPKLASVPGRRERGTAEARVFAP